jgi:hypothetical protein
MSPMPFYPLPMGAFSQSLPPGGAAASLLNPGFQFATWLPPPRPMMAPVLPLSHSVPAVVAVPAMNPPSVAASTPPVTTFAAAAVPSATTSGSSKFPASGHVVDIAVAADVVRGESESQGAADGSERQQVQQQKTSNMAPVSPRPVRTGSAQHMQVGSGQDDKLMLLFIHK